MKLQEMNVIAFGIWNFSTFSKICLNMSLIADKVQTSCMPFETYIALCGQATNGILICLVLIGPEHKM